MCVLFIAFLISYLLLFFLIYQILLTFYSSLKCEFCVSQGLETTRTHFRYQTAEAEGTWH